jgi:ketosteroid isomerase-like protein
MCPPRSQRSADRNRWQTRSASSHISSAFNAAINARDVAALDRLTTDDHALIDSARFAIEGREEVFGAWRGFFDT